MVIKVDSVINDGNPYKKKKPGGRCVHKETTAHVKVAFMSRGKSPRLEPSIAPIRRS